MISSYDIKECARIVADGLGRIGMSGDTEDLIQDVLRQTGTYVEYKTIELESKLPIDIQRERRIGNYRGRSR